MSNKQWTRADDDVLRELVEANARLDVIAAKMNRSPSQIILRGYIIGLPRKWQVPTKSNIEPKTKR